MDIQSSPSVINSSTVSTISADSLIESLDMLQVKASNTTCSLNDMPNEMLILILKRVRLHRLIRFRLVCSRWQMAIEVICRKTQSLHLYAYHDCVIFARGDFCARFFDQIKQKEFFEIGIRNLREIDSTFLAKLFPDVSQFVISWDFDSDFVTHLVFLLGKWSNSLVTLSLNMYFYRLNPDATLLMNSLFDRINSLTALRQLDLFGYRKKLSIVQLAPALLRLEHFSVDFNTNLLDVMSNLGANCTRLSLCENHHAHTFRRSLTSNPSLVGQITHLNLTFSNLTNVLPLICQHFISLQVLRLSFSCNHPTFHLTTNSFLQLRKLRQLNYLRFHNVHLDVSQLQPMATLSPLPSIRVFALSSIIFTNGTHMHLRHFGDKFCRAFSIILPNMNDLTIGSPNRTCRTKIEQKLNLFTNLRNYRIDYRNLA